MNGTERIIAEGSVFGSLSGIQALFSNSMCVCSLNLGTLFRILIEIASKKLVGNIPTHRNKIRDCCQPLSNQNMLYKILLKNAFVRSS